MTDNGSISSEVSGTSEMLDTGPSEFGQWLQAERIKQDISVQGLAEISNVSFVQIYNIESGTSQNPQQKTRQKLIKALESSSSPELEKIIQDTEKAATVTDVGEFIDFDPHEDVDLPEQAGVYVFYDISERPIYIGQSSNIKRRIMDHQTRFWYKSPIVYSASFIKIEDEKLREKIEKVIIKILKSQALINKHHVNR